MNEDENFKIAEFRDIRVEVSDDITKEERAEARLYTMVRFKKRFKLVCDICGSDRNLVDAKKSLSRSVDAMVKLCNVPCVRPIQLLVMGYSYDVEVEQE